MSPEDFAADMKRLTWVSKVVVQADRIDIDYANRIEAKKKWVNDSLKKVFFHIDKDGNGEITKPEFEALIEGPKGKKLGSPRSNKMYKSIDADGSGTIDEGEVSSPQSIRRVGIESG